MEHPDADVMVIDPDDTSDFDYVGEIAYYGESDRFHLLSSDFAAMQAGGEPRRGQDLPDAIPLDPSFDHHQLLGAIFERKTADLEDANLCEFGYRFTDTERLDWLTKIGFCTTNKKLNPADAEHDPGVWCWRRQAGDIQFEEWKWGAAWLPQDFKDSRDAIDAAMLATGLVPNATIQRK
jgi:hypothetical protein